MDCTNHTDWVHRPGPKAINHKEHKGHDANEACEALIMAWDTLLLPDGSLVFFVVESVWKDRIRVILGIRGKKGCLLRALRGSA